MWSEFWSEYKIESLIFNLGALSIFWNDVLPATSSSWKQVEYAYSFYKRYSLSKNYFSIPKNQSVVKEFAEMAIPVTPSVHDTIGYGVFFGMLMDNF